MKVKFKFIIVITSLIFIATLFYWFQFRPTQIKHDCSWVEVYQNAIPASPGVTIQEVEASKKEHPECKDVINTSSGYQSIFQNNGADLLCFAVIKQYKAPQPAQPAKNWWKPATSKQYEFCLHDKGL